MKMITVTAVERVLRSLVNESTVKETIARIESSGDLIEAADVESVRRIPSRATQASRARASGHRRAEYAS